MSEVWSVDGESFIHNSLGNLLETHAAAVGSVVYVGDAIKPTVEQIIDARDVIELIADRGGDLGGEWAEDFPDVTKEAESELDALLRQWFEKHCEVTFYTVENIRAHTVAGGDVAAVTVSEVKP
jgi:hypothetical protein